VGQSGPHATAEIDKAQLLRLRSASINARVGTGPVALRKTETRKSTSSSVNRTGSAGWLIETPFVIGESPDGQVSSKLA